MSKQRPQTTIGVDVSKGKLDIYCSASKVSQTIKNDARAIGKWLTTTKAEFTVDKLVLEPTGGYEDKLLQQLFAKQVPSFFVHTTLINSYKKSQGVKAKTDKLDAFYLAEHALASPSKLKRISGFHFKNKALAELLVASRQLKQAIGKLKNQQEHGFHHKQIKSINKRLLKMHSEELEKVESLILEEINIDKEKKEKYNLLQTLKSIGPANAKAFTAQVPELGKVDRRSICSLIGVAPFNRDSGKHNGKRSIQGGRAEVRCKLYMAALVAIRHNPEMKKVYERLRSQGKAAKIAIVAVMRRLLCIMNAMVRDNKPYKAMTAVTN
jgi:transposase